MHPRHKYQQLPLIPVDEFLALHPEHADADENALMVARIEHERTEREALEQQRQELLKRKQKLIADNKKRKDDLANLDKDLEKFIDVGPPYRGRLPLGGRDANDCLPHRPQNRFRCFSRRWSEAQGRGWVYSIASATTDVTRYLSDRTAALRRGWAVPLGSHISSEGGRVLP